VPLSSFNCLILILRYFNDLLTDPSLKYKVCLMVGMIGNTWKWNYLTKAKIYHLYSKIIVQNENVTQNKSADFFASSLTKSDCCCFREKTENVFRLLFNRFFGGKTWNFYVKFFPSSILMDFLTKIIFPILHVFSLNF